jgi:hypothetical protein
LPDRTFAAGLCHASNDVGYSYIALGLVGAGFFKYFLENMALHMKMSCFFLEIISVFGLKMPKTGKIS